MKSLLSNPRICRSSHGELVTRSQAEELLARKDYLLSVSDTVAAQLQNKIVTLTLQKEALETDNAAKDERIKELEADVKREAQSSTYNAQDCLDEQLRAEALEAKLAAAQKAARAAHDTLIEINPSNYNHDDVCQLNDASVEAIFLLADILGETHGKTKEWWDERRAVLGGEP